ncbi:hypothetical protein MRX96_006466 [Rhipicephalus microplus]
MVSGSRNFRSLVLATRNLSSEKVLGGRPLSGFALSLRSTLYSLEVANERLPTDQAEGDGGGYQEGVCTQTRASTKDLAGYGARRHGCATLHPCIIILSHQLLPPPPPRYSSPLHRPRVSPAATTPARPG